jgi:hypothetical protein
MGVIGQDKASWQTEDLPFKIVIRLLEHVAECTILREEVDYGKNPLSTWLDW